MPADSHRPDEVLSVKWVVVVLVGRVRFEFWKAICQHFGIYAYDCLEFLVL